MTRLGLISDTHGLLRPEALAALRGVDRIIHAGDIGGVEVLQALRALAPLDAVRGNNDKGAWATPLPLRLTLTVDDLRIYVLHGLHELDLDPAAAGIDVVVAGHSHQPGVRSDGGVLYVNPGSAGPRRFRLPVTLGYLTTAAGAAQAAIAPLL